jgi:hypothetical protein
MANALRRLLNDPDFAREMGEKARSLGAAMYWPVVAASYESLFAELVSDAARVPTPFRDFVRIA